MRIDYVPLLERQREVYRVPFGVARFREYLRSMLNETGDDVDSPPMVLMNPMAREHVPFMLDQYIQLEADRIAAQAVEEACAAIEHVDAAMKISLVVVDDLKGGWTNRYACEYQIRRGGLDRSGERFLKRSAWHAAPIWTGEPVSIPAIEREAKTTVFRAARRVIRGTARTVHALLDQEGVCMFAAGYDKIMIDSDEIAYTRAVIDPYLEADDMAIGVACLFGDGAARSLGFKPLGLSRNAGLELALHDSIAKGDRIG